MVKKLNLGVIPGDGIGGEVTAEALSTLSAATAGVIDVSVTEYSLGADHFLATGEILPEETMADLEPRRPFTGGGRWGPIRP